MMQRGTGWPHGNGTAFGRALLRLMPVLLLILLFWVVQARIAGLDAYLPANSGGWQRIVTASWQGPDEREPATVALPHMVRSLRDEAFETHYRITLPEPIAAERSPLALCIPRLSMSARIVRNGRIVQDTMANGVLQYTRPLLVQLPPETGRAESAAIDIFLVALPGFDPGLSEVYAGRSDIVGIACERFAEAKREQAFALAVAMLILGAVAFVLFLRLGDRPSLWFALAAILWALHFFYTTNLRLPVSDRSWLMGYYLLRPAYGPALILFCLSFSGGEWRRARLFLLAWLVANAALLPMLPQSQWAYWMTLNALFWLTAMILTLAILGWRTRKDLSFSASWLTIAFFFVVVAHGFDILRWIGLAPYGAVSLSYLSVPVLMFAFAGMMVDRMIKLSRENDRYVANLAQIVESQRVEIENSYKAMEAERTRRTATEERQRIMRDMHDGVGSMLVAARSALEQANPDTAELRELIDSALLDLRGGIQVAYIDAHTSLQDALTDLLAAFRYRIEGPLRTRGIVLDWQMEPMSVPLLATPAELLNLLRILQEAFTNIIRHSGASEARFHARMAGSSAILIIADNGRGGVTSATDGIGVNSMKRRASDLGAMLTIDSGQNGTTVRLIIPGNPV